MGIKCKYPPCAHRLAYNVSASCFSIGGLNCGIFCRVLGKYTLKSTCFVWYSAAVQGRQQGQSLKIMVFGIGWPVMPEGYLVTVFACSSCKSFAIDCTSSGYFAAWLFCSPGSLLKSYNCAVGKLPNKMRVF